MSCDFTPLNENYATCERAVAELRVYSEVLTVAQISSIVGHAPTSCRDGYSQTQLKSTRLPPRTVWVLCSSDIVSSRDLRHHLDWLLAKLSEAALAELQRHHQTKMCIYCLWWSKYGHGGPTINPDQMQTMARLNLQCALDVSFYEDDEGLLAIDLAT